MAALLQASPPRDVRAVAEKVVREAWGVLGWTTRPMDRTALQMDWNRCGRCISCLALLTPAKPSAAVAGPAGAFYHAALALFSGLSSSMGSLSLSHAICEGLGVCEDLGRLFYNEVNFLRVG